MHYIEMLTTATAGIQKIASTKMKSFREAKAASVKFNNYLVTAQDALEKILQNPSALDSLNALCDFEYQLSRIHKNTYLSPKTFNIATLSSITSSMTSEMTIGQLSRHLTAVVNFVDYKHISPFQVPALVSPILEKISKVKNGIGTYSTADMLYPLLKLSYFRGEEYGGTLKQLTSQIFVEDLKYLPREQSHKLKLAYAAMPNLFRHIKDLISSLSYAPRAEDVTISKAQAKFFESIHSFIPAAKSEYYIPALSRSVDIYIEKNGIKLIIEYDGPTHKVKVKGVSQNRGSDQFNDHIAKQHGFETIRFSYNDTRIISEVIKEQFPQLISGQLLPTLSANSFAALEEFIDWTDDSDLDESEAAPMQAESATASFAAAMTSIKTKPKSSKQAKASKMSDPAAKILDNKIGDIILSSTPNTLISTIRSAIKEIEDGSIDPNEYPSIVFRFMETKAHYKLFTEFSTKVSSPITNLKEIIEHLSVCPEQLEHRIKLLIENRLIEGKCSIANLQTYISSQKSLKITHIQHLIKSLCYINYDSWNDLKFLDKHDYLAPGMFNKIFLDTGSKKGVYTPLVYCIIGKHFELADFLLSNGANPDAIASSLDLPILMYFLGQYFYQASQNDKHDNEEAIKLLLKYHVNTECLNNKRKGALDFSLSQSAPPNIIKLLLEHGADANSLNISNLTPLEVAIEEEASIEIIKLLLDNKANVNYVNAEGASILQLALTSYKASTEIIKLLLDNKANVNYVNAEGASILQLALTSYVAPELIQILVDYGCDVNHPFLHQTSILEYAVKHPYIAYEVIPILLQAGAKTGHAQNPRDHILSHAVHHKEATKLISLLFKYRDEANINFRGEEGAVALNSAILAKQLHITQQLLEAGVDIHLKIEALGGTSIFEEFTSEYSCLPEIRSLLKTHIASQQLDVRVASTLDTDSNPAEILNEGESLPAIADIVGNDSLVE